MSLATELLQYFEQFWKHAVQATASGHVQNTTPLLRVGPNWQHWYKVKLTLLDQKRLEALGKELPCREQEQFITLLHDWGCQQFGEYAEGALWVIHLQLARLPLFQPWLHNKVFDSWEGPNAIIVLSGRAGGQADDITPLRVVCIPHALTDPRCTLYKINMADNTDLGEVESVESGIYPALLRLCGRGCFSSLMWLFLICWGLGGWIYRPSRTRNPLLVVWGLIALILISLLSSGYLSNTLAESGLLVSLLWGLLGLGCLPLGGAVRRVYHEWRLMQRHQSRLQNAHLVVVLLRRHEVGIEHVTGASFALPVSLSLLAALVKPAGASTSALKRLTTHTNSTDALVKPAGASTSALAWCVSRLVKSWTFWSCTGTLGKSGIIGSVDRADDKIAASQAARPHIKYIVLPRRQWHDWLQHIWTHYRLFRASEPPPQPAATEATEAPLRVYRRWHLVSVLLTIGWGDGPPWPRRGARLVRAALLGSMALLLGALPGISSILLPPLAPQLFVQKSGLLSLEIHGTREDVLRLVFDGDTPRPFVVYFHSRFWANREQQVHQLDTPPKPGVVIQLDKLTQPSVNDPLDGEITIVSPRSIWWRTLPPVVVEKISLRYLHEIARTGREKSRGTL